MSELKAEQLSFLSRGPYNFGVSGKMIMGLSGVSGSGKSLLLRALCDLEPHSGRITLGETDSQNISGPEWRRRVAFMPAESLWWHETAGLHFAKSPQADCLNALGFSDDVMTWEISRLSSGEKQRLALLRLLQNKPLALLLDEPTASLDPKNAQAVEKFIVNYLEAHDAPSLWVSHDHEQLARVASQHCEILPGGEMRRLR